MRLYKILLTLLFISSIFTVSAQRRPYRVFKTQEVERKLRKDRPEIIDEKNRIEANVYDYQRRNFSKQDLKKKQYVGVVFHVLYTPGTAFPGEEQIYSQLEALNRDFGNNRIQFNHPADSLEGFANNAAIIELLFCIPEKLPRNESAIRFIATGVQEWRTDNAIKFSEKGGSDPVDPKKYLNVWVANLADDVSGYAQMPGGPDATDGIVIDYKYFGTLGTAIAPYNQGKTLTHLVGSYLGLYELWSEYNFCGDDYVNDTPIHNAPNFSQYPYRHVSTCANTPAEMVMNFMDNTDDEGMYMFTTGQKIRILAMLSGSGPRKGILTQETQCSSSSNIQNLALESNTTNEVKSIWINAYPNPAKDQVTLDAFLNQKEKGHIVIFNTMGTLIHNIDFSSTAAVQRFSISTSDWATGTYFIKLSVEDQIDYCRLVIIKD